MAKNKFFNKIAKKYGIRFVAGRFVAGATLDSALSIIELQLKNGNYAGVATHDEAMIEHTKQFVKEHQIPLDQFEFQMLYGIRVELQMKLVEEGYRVRIYVPYGEDWYGYFMRRLAERPANVAFVLKGIFKK